MIDLQHLSHTSLACTHTFKGSRKSATGRLCNCASTSLSNTFRMAEVKATGRNKSFITFTVVFFGTGIMQEVFHKARMLGVRCPFNTKHKHRHRNRHTQKQTHTHTHTHIHRVTHTHARTHARTHDARTQARTHTHTHCPDWLNLATMDYHFSSLNSVFHCQKEIDKMTD